MAEVTVIRLERTRFLGGTGSPLVAESAPEPPGIVKYIWPNEIIFFTFTYGFTEIRGPIALPQLHFGGPRSVREVEPNVDHMNGFFYYLPPKK